MKVLVTGGAGFIGSHIVDKLIQSGHRVIIVDNLASGKKENINPKAEFYEVDIRNMPDLEKIFREESPDIVNHHAAQNDVTTSMKDPAFDASVNILGSLNLINLSVTYKIKKFIFASTSVVYPDTNDLPTSEEYLIKPISAYGISKYAIEQYLKLYNENYGLKYTIFRYGNVYGPRQDPNGESGVVAIFSKQISEGIRPTIFGDGNKTRDYIHIDDVISANMLVLDKLGNGNVYNLGWGREISDFEVLDTVRKTLGVKVDPIYGKKRKGEHSRVCLDPSKAKAEIGWIPKVSFEVGIPQYSKLLQ